MTTAYGFNWSWVADKENTKKASEVVQQGGGTIYSFRQAAGGAVSSQELSAFSKSVAMNLQSIRSDWRTYIRPVLNSLPAGGTDQRWSTEVGKGLPDKIDCFAYGIQGSTLFVFNDANEIKADGRYWKSDEYRPYTIAESFENVYQAISDIETNADDSNFVDIDPLWAAIGEDYRDSGKVGADGSLDTRTGTLETYMNQLNNDIYEPTEYTYGIGTPLPYSIANMLDKLLKIHEVSGGFGENPENVAHGDATVAPHTHSFDEVLPPPSNSLTQGRVGPYTSLENEVLRLRFEIGAVKGVDWQTDATSPFAGSPTVTLHQHVNFTGSGTATTNNPHGINYSDTGAGTVFDAVRAFTGMSSNTDSTPTYTSTNYVSQGSSLETAIGALDTAVNTLLGSSISRLDYNYDRSVMSETDRANTPIQITHSLGKKPIVEVLDVSPTIEDYYGQYSSPAVDVNIVHVDENNIEIWTEAAKIEVIMIG
jgi:hypothetical protein